MKVTIEEHGVAFSGDMARVDVVAICSDPRFGQVFGWRTPREELEIRVTPTGLVRVRRLGKTVV